MKITLSWSKVRVSEDLSYWESTVVTILTQPKPHIYVKTPLSGNISTRPRMYKVLLFKFRCYVKVYITRKTTTKLLWNSIGNFFSLKKIFFSS